MEDKKITIEELEQHSNWTSINGKVYDLTEFIENNIHPGGSIIRLALGRDASDLFQSYHTGEGMLSVRRMLPTLPLVGILEETPSSVNTGHKFYITLRQRVERALEEEGHTRHSFELLHLVEFMITVGLYLLCSANCILEESLLWPILSGIVIGRLGFMQHTGNHCAASIYSDVNEWVGKSMNWIGGNQVVWRHEHQIAHHLAPNVLGKDNDCEIGYPYIRLHPDLTWKWYHVFQPLTVLLGMSIGLVKWNLSDLIHLRDRKVGNVPIRSLTRQEVIELIVSKVSWWMVHFVLPCVSWGFWNGVQNGLLKFAIASLYIENIFIVNHIQKDNQELSNSTSESESEHWAIQQVKGTSNWSSGSTWWNWFSGGLNHQIEHHLFPSIHPYVYPRISAVVQETCQDFGLEYHSYSSFGTAWCHMFKYIGLLGFNRHLKKRE